MNNNIKNMVKLANAIEWKLANDLSGEQFSGSDLEKGKKKKVEKDIADKLMLDDLEVKVNAIVEKIKKETKNYEQPHQMQWWQYPDYKLPASKRILNALSNHLSELNKKGGFNSTNLTHFLNIESKLSEVIEKGFTHGEGIPVDHYATGTYK